MWRRNSDPYGFGGMFDDPDPWSDGFGGGFSRRGMAPVSQRALGAFDRAKSIFLKHLATVDTSKGPVTEEIIDFHLVSDMKTKFNKLAREHGCVPSQRKLTREEQDRINKSRQSLMSFSSVKVTPEAQKAYLEKHPNAKPKTGTAQPAEASSSSTPLQSQKPNSKKRTLDDATASKACGSIGKKAKTK